MELEKHKTESTSSNILRKKIMNTAGYDKEPVEFDVMEPGFSPVGPGTCPLTFTFVPNTGTLPTEVLVGKDSNITPKVVKISSSWRREEMTQKPEGISENVTEKKMIVEDKNATVCHKSSSEEIYPGIGISSNTVDDLQQSDLFLAEFVLVVDSEEDEEEIKKNNTEILSYEVYESSGTQGSAIANASSIKVNEILVPETQNDEQSNDVAHEVKELQLLSSVKSAGHTPINLQDTKITYSKKQRQSIPCLFESQEYSTYCAPLNIQNEKAKIHEHSTLLNQPSIKAPSPPIITQQTTSHITSSNIILSPHYLSNLKIHNPGAPEPQIDAYNRSRALSPLPIQIIKYPLCPSPSPLQSPLYGSSSTISSLNDPCNPVSPVERPEVASPVPSRLSFLTSILKFKKTNRQRSFSPDFYQYKLISKQAQPSPCKQASYTLPRKAFSCFSLDNPHGSKMTYFQRKGINQFEMLPSASESNIKDADYSFHKPIRTLSPDSIHFKTSKNMFQPRNIVTSPSSQYQKTVSPYTSRESMSPLNVKPPLMKDTHKPIKKYSVLGKSRNVSPPAISPSNLSHSLPNFFIQKQTLSPHSKKKKYTVTTNQFSSTSYTSRNVPNQDPNKDTHITKSPFANLQEKPYFQSMNSILKNSQPLQSNYRSNSNSLSLEKLPTKYKPEYESSANIQSPSRSVLSRSSDLPSPHSLSQCSDYENKKSYKIKSNYKVFAAIPTNTLLLDQKAIDEPEINIGNALEETMETHSEMYSPAHLRQQTEEVCAAIDQVLHDPLPMHNESTSKSSKKKLGSKMQISNSAGRETKYASLQLPKARSSSQSTKPGVIRPLSLKVYTPEMDDENYYPNPFKQFTLGSSRRGKKLEDDFPAFLSSIQ